MDILKELNEEQIKPATETEGPILVTAGAGSGKTRLLTHRIAFLIKEKNVAPYNIVAITFTNKAANEMRKRITNLVDNCNGIWIMTFHAACVRILREFIDKLNFNKNFTIYGENEKSQMIKIILKDMNIADDEYRKNVIWHISKAKNDNYTPDEYLNENSRTNNIDTICKVYKAYQDSLQKNNALDFDDLLLKTYELLKNDETVRNYYHNKFQYVLIDEFQDTNKVQYDIAKLLVNEKHNIFVVGDEDQCIYSWRGASISNIFDFKKDFKEVKVYKLEQNYRSSKNIIDLANTVIKSNTMRLEKVLWTQNADGFKVQMFSSPEEYDEAEYVVRQIKGLMIDYGYKAKDFAILMRLNALTRTFEDRLLNYNINYKVLGGLKFYERAEVKNILAYLNVLVNEFDDQSLIRIINFPKRGIGQASIDDLKNIAYNYNFSILNFLLSDEFENLSPKLYTKLKGFITLIKELKQEMKEKKLLDFIKLLIVKTGIREIYNEKDVEDFNRILNIDAFLSSVQEYVKVNGDVELSDFLQSISLISDIDNLDDEDDGVLISTVHAVKGLEFKVVFLIGLEDGTFPILRNGYASEADIEEERRLLYVAITRAKERLYLTRSQSRFKYGKRDYNILPSRFIMEMQDCKSIDTKYFPKKATISDFGQKQNNNVYLKPLSSLYSIDKNANSNTYSDYKVGVKVEHPRFGIGVIINTDNLQKHKLINVDFEDFGVKVLAIEIAPLTVIKD